MKTQPSLTQASFTARSPYMIPTVHLKFLQMIVKRQRFATNIIVTFPNTEHIRPLSFRKVNFHELIWMEIQTGSRYLAHGHHFH